VVKRVTAQDRLNCTVIGTNTKLKYLKTNESSVFDGKVSDVESLCF
jgi:hypothetical protein